MNKGFEQSFPFFFGSSGICVKDEKFKPLSSLRKLKFAVFLTFFFFLMVYKNTFTTFPVEPNF